AISRLCNSTASRKKKGQSNEYKNTLKHGSLLELWPTFRRDPGTALRSHFVWPSRRQNFLRPCHHAVIELRDLFFVKKFVPRLHRPVGASVSNGGPEICQSEFQIGINQVRRKRAANGVHAVAPVAVNVPPFPSGVDILIDLPQLLRPRGLDENCPYHRRS